MKYPFMLKVLVLVFMPYLLSSCRRIPLHDSESSIFLKLELEMEMPVAWEEFPIDEDKELYVKVYGKMPELVRACFYDINTHKLMYEDYLPPEGGFIEIADGEYDVIVYSLSTEVTQVTGTEMRAGSYAFTSFSGSKVKVLSKAGGDSPLPAELNINYEPDHIYVARIPSVVIPALTVGENRVVVIEGKMEPLLKTYSFEVRNVNGTENIQTVVAYVTGLASGKYLWDFRYPSHPCAISIPVRIDHENGRLYYIFNTFGKFPNTESDVFLSIVVGTEGGGKYQWTFNVTEMFTNPDNIGNEVVIDDPVDIPAGGGDGGLNPSVDDWNTEIIDIPLS